MSEPKNNPGKPGGEAAPKAEEKPPEKSLLDRAKEGETLTPEQLAEATGNVKQRVSTVQFGGQEPKGLAYSALHLGAAQLHGWAAHQHHGADAPLKLTLGDYQKALEAAGKGNPPHEGACSKHLPKAHKQRLDAFKAEAQKGNK